jgi:hypothetical protein
VNLVYLIAKEDPDSKAFDVVFSANDKYLGEIYLEVDGSYVFLPGFVEGAWTQEVLAALAEEMKKLNDQEPTP